MTNNYKYTMTFTNGVFGGSPSIRMNDDISELPPNVVIVDTAEELDIYLNAWNTGVKDVTLVNGEIQIVDKYTPEELAAQQAQAAAQALINQANAQIARDEYLWTNQIVWQRHTDQQRADIMVYYDSLIAVVNGESDTLPILEGF